MIATFLCLINVFIVSDVEHYAVTMTVAMKLISMKHVATMPVVMIVMVATTLIVMSRDLLAPLLMMFLVTLEVAVRFDAWQMWH